ncbi:hypothetical protein [Microbacterium sp.]|uniref:hypothetical protein n=1 Tax=Microbacterium sp. TaxID=51671 RepID=UPI0028126009|nr:hypothetical protein [Microbacterium sp.]
MTDDHVLGPGLLPTPFTAAEIRESSRAGKTILLRVEQPDGTSYERVNRFRDGDDEGATLEQWRTDAPGELSSRRVTWRELQEHAAFAADRTTVTSETVDLPLGRLECLRYETRDEPDAVPATFWFALAHPGMPVRFDAPAAGGGVIRTTVLEVEPGQAIPPPSTTSAEPVT